MAPPPDRVTTPPVVPFPTARPCPAGSSDLAGTPETQQEAAFARTLRACLHDATPHVTLINAGPVVWVLDEPAMHWPDVPTPDLELDVYRSAVRELGLPGLTIEPRQSVTVPVPPGQPVHLSLRLDPQAQVVWEMTTRGVRAARAQLQEQAVDYLGRGRPGRRAVLVCASNAAYFAESHGPRSGGPLSYDAMYLDIAKDGGECAVAVSRARQQQTRSVAVTDFAPDARRGATAAQLSRRAVAVAAGSVAKLCVGLPRGC